MRTKSLLLAAALLSFAGASAMAQVYSVNAVGFVNITLPAGKFKMIGNPLHTTDNTLGSLIKDLPGGTQYYKYTSAGFEVNGFNGTVWDDPAMTMNPGEGGFIKIPAGTDKTITFVGEVLQTSGPIPLTLQLNPGFQIVSSMIPQKLVLSAPAGTPSLDFPAENGDTVYLFRDGYETHGFSGGAWDMNPGPTPEVGEAFWVRKVSAKSWTRTFSVN